MAWLQWDVGLPLYALKLVDMKELTEQERICPVSDMDEIESEIHVMICCPLYNDIRAILYESVLVIVNDFNSYSNMNFFLFLMDNEGIKRNCAKACHSILHRRRRYVYINDWISLS